MSHTKLSTEIANLQAELDAGTTRRRICLPYEAWYGEAARKGRHHDEIHEISVGLESYANGQHEACVAEWRLVWTRFRDGLSLRVDAAEEAWVAMAAIGFQEFLAGLAAGDLVSYDKVKQSLIESGFEDTTAYTAPRFGHV
ncbi:hypothetical protein ACFV9C_41975 [Kribbella sp. NPDC059898]|uniref:hypothetical protein n=1 Tax=Kribbella sp. NPDC059898 TaxID=3346995 RepID=UPI003660C9C8